MSNLVLPKLLTVEALKSSGIHIGSPVRSLDMKPFVETINPEGIPFFNLNQTLERLDIGGKFIASFHPRQVVVFSTLERAEKAVHTFSTLTHCIGITKRMVPGTLTNPVLPAYVDAELLVVTDPTNGVPLPEDEGMEARKGEARAMDEASASGIPVLAICNTDASLQGVDFAIPANNRGNKALAVVFYLLTRSVLIHRGELKPEEDVDWGILDFEMPLKKEENAQETEPQAQPASPSTL